MLLKVRLHYYIYLFIELILPNFHIHSPKILCDELQLII